MFLEEASFWQKENKKILIFKTQIGKRQEASGKRIRKFSKYSNWEEAKLWRKEE
jgi:hypothetical protein